MHRRVLAVLVFATLFIGGLEPLHFRILVGDPTAPLPYPERHTVGYREFLEGVGARTRPGDSIVLVVPIRYWRTGYGYAYYRANYFLAGRRVIPILDDEDRIRRERLQQGDFVALWRLPELPGYDVVWQGHGGALLRRPR